MSSGYTYTRMYDFSQMLNEWKERKREREMTSTEVLPTFVFLSGEGHMLISKKEFASYEKVSTLVKSILWEGD